MNQGTFFEPRSLEGHKKENRNQGAREIDKNPDLSTEFPEEES